MAGSSIEDGAAHLLPGQDPSHDSGEFHVSTVMKNAFPERLISGYRTFATQRLPTEQSRYRELSERGQSPQVMVIGCCNSRVSPEVIFDAEPGELFVVRNVANLVPPYAPDGAAHGVSAALEFGVQVLRVKHIVVLGHAQCGGVKALVQDSAPLSPGDFIGKWMSLLTPTMEATPRVPGEAGAGFHHAAGEGRGPPQPRQPDDVPVHQHSGRTRLAVAARRVFRRRAGIAGGARRSERRVQEGERRCGNAPPSLRAKRSNPAARRQARKRR